MNYIELVVGMDNGYAAIPITHAWANILKRSKSVGDLKTLVMSHGVNWNRVIYAKIEEQKDGEFSIHNLLDCSG